MEEPVVSGAEITPQAVQDTPATEAPLVPNDFASLDPGQLEGKPKHEPPVGSPRWNEVYHKAKDTERQLEAERAEKAVVSARVAELEEQNRQMAARAAQPLQQYPQYQQLAPPLPPQPQFNPEAALQQLMGERAVAFKDMEMEKAAGIQDNIDKLIMFMSKPDPVQIMGQYQAMEQAKDISRFAQTVSWFGQVKPNGAINPDHDPIMEGAAISLEKQMLPTWKGSYPELLTVVKKQVEDRLGQ